MHLVILGLNHKTAPVEVRERFSLSRENIIKGLKNLPLYQTLDEAVVLSTCNRSEIYAVVDEKTANVRQLKQFWFDLSGSNEEIDEYLYSFYDEECIRHLFRVASSLDSLIIGEGQILSQVKEAYSIAREENSTSTILNTLFHRAIATGKRVRTETRIAFNAVSVSYAAVELAKRSSAPWRSPTFSFTGPVKWRSWPPKTFWGPGPGKFTWPTATGIKLRSWPAVSTEPPSASTTLSPKPVIPTW